MDNAVEKAVKRIVDEKTAECELYIKGLQEECSRSMEELGEMIAEAKGRRGELAEKFRELDERLADAAETIDGAQKQE